jgi:HEAT repeat protein
MKNSFDPNGYLSRGVAEKVNPRIFGVGLVAAAVILLFVSTILPSFRAEAQRPTVKVNHVSATSGNGGTSVSIAANGSLGRAQTWQDSEGYHVVIPDTVASESMKTARGVKVRRVGTSLEIVLQTKPGASVNVQSFDNKLQLDIAGKLDNRSTDRDSKSSDETAQSREPQYAVPARQDNFPTRFSSPLGDAASRSIAPAVETAHKSSNWNPQMGPQASASVQTPVQTTQPLASAEPTQIEIQPEDDGFLASVFSGSSVFVVMALGVFGLLVSRKLRSRQAAVEAVAAKSGEEGDEDEVFETTLQGSSPVQTSTSLVTSGKAARSASSNGPAVLTRQVAGPTSLFGAYRIDQEVGKLVYGQPHRLDVLSSRAIDDRRAIETSLIKSVNSPDLDENGRRRAREALEEYGFVARQCAALLLAADAFERTSAARALGETKSPAALPFLLEGLYDSESIVRNQAVMSIGELKLPAAIGALLDIARTHPDVPSALLSRTLSACSVEGLDFFDAVMPEPALLEAGVDNDVVEQITHLEPTHSVTELPVTEDDEQLKRALVLATSSDVQERAEALKTLVQFRDQRAVDAMSLIARDDSEPNLRSSAITNLGVINHESVFPSILIGMADEAREVRAASARSLNRLSFDRAEAYVRVIENSDEATIGSVAKACIQAGIVSQNLDRLSTSDHRQAYETFSLICLLAKAKMYQPVLDAIADHSNGDVRIKAVHLLACTGQPEVFDQLRELAVKEGMREDVKTALLEALYKLEQSKQKEEETDAAAVPASEREIEGLVAEDVANVTEEAATELTTDFDVEVIPPFDSEEDLVAETEGQFEFGPTIEAATLEEVEE